MTAYIRLAHHRMTTYITEHQTDAQRTLYRVWWEDGSPIATVPDDLQRAREIEWAAYNAQACTCGPDTGRNPLTGADGPSCPREDECMAAWHASRAV